MVPLISNFTETTSNLKKDVEATSVEMKRDMYIGLIAFVAGGFFIEVTLDFIGLGLVGLGFYYIMKTAIRDATPKS